MSHTSRFSLIRKCHK